MLEPVGVAAYAGAGPYIRSFPILRAALSIHSVEANHAAWASTLLKLKRIDTSVSPAPFANNPVFGYRRTLREVEKTGFVKG